MSLQRNNPKFNPELPVLLEVKYEGEVFTVDEVSNLLKAYNDQYTRYVNNELLIINDIKKGSLELSIQEIIEVFGAVYPAIAQSGIYKLYSNFKDVIDLFTNKQPTKEEAIENNITIKKCDNVANVLTPVAKDNANQINISVTNDNSIHYHFNISGEKASSVVNRAKQTKKLLNEKTQEDFQNEAFRFQQIRKEIKTGIGDRVVVPNISEKPLKVKYDDVVIKEQIVEADENTFRFTLYGDISIEFKHEKPDTCIIKELNDIQLDDNF